MIIKPVLLPICLDYMTEGKDKTEAENNEGRDDSINFQPRECALLNHFFLLQWETVLFM